jgi:hypothetical protein
LNPCCGFISLYDLVVELVKRLTGIFLRDKNGHRPVFGQNEKFQKDAQFKDYLLFYEYFHGDNGRGVGASHQTGWTAIVARMLFSIQEEEKWKNVH